MPEPAPSSPRLASLDALRGLTIAMMVLVNNPGSWSHVYRPLRHAEWNGCTPTDLVFPFFLFMVGASMAFSFARYEAGERLGPNGLARILRRVALLFALGLVLNGFWRYDLANLRIPGVLQRIALAYGLGAWIVIALRPRMQVVVAAILLGGYQALLFLVEVPGGRAGDLAPGADLGAWLDRTLLGPAHLWAGADHRYDPEGLLSTVPAVVTVLLGVWTGRFVRGQPRVAATVTPLALAGFLLLVAGLLWGRWFPINKSLWSSSYVLYTGGFAVLFFALSYHVIDVMGIRGLAEPFAVFGRNAILLFVGSGLVARALSLTQVGDTSAHGWLFAQLDGWVSSPYRASLVFALATVSIWWCFLLPLHRRRWYVTV